MTVAELQHTMSARELRGWVELERIRVKEREDAERKAKRGR